MKTKLILILAMVTTLTAYPQTTGPEVGVNDFRISMSGPDGDADYDVFSTDVTYNSITDQFLVVWSGEDNTPPLVEGENEIFGQFLDGMGNAIGANFRISSQGPDGDGSYDADIPAIAYNSTDNQYLVVWKGDAALNEDEIFGKLLGADGSYLSDDVRISFMGPDGNSAYDATNPAVAYNSLENEYLVVWNGDDQAPLVSGENEIFGSIVTSGLSPGVAFQISDMGPIQAISFDALRPKVSYNSIDNEYLVVWDGDDNTGALVDGEIEIYGQRLTAAGAETGVNDFRISNMGPDGDADFDAAGAAVVFNSISGEYLVTWSGEDDTGTLVEGEFEIFGQRLSAAGAEIGVNDFRISNMGPDGDGTFGTFVQTVAYNSTTGDYLVIWTGSDDTGNLVINELEIFGQRLTPTGVEIGIDDFRISDMGPDGDDSYGAGVVALAYNSTAFEFLAVWYGDDNTFPLVDNEFEIFGQRLHFAPPAPASFNLLVGDPNTDAIYRVNPVTGDRTIVADDATGTGPAITGNSFMEVGNDGFIITQSDDGIVNVNPLTGNRTVLLPGFPLGDMFLGQDGQYYGIGFDNTLANVRVERLNLNTGVFTVISDASTGVGPMFTDLLAITADADGNFFVFDSDGPNRGIIKVDRNTGDRTMISDASHDISNAGDYYDEIIYHPDLNKILAHDSNGFIAQIDPVTGVRSIHSDFSDGGPVSTVVEMALSPDGSIYGAGDQGVMKIDPITGAREAISGYFGSSGNPGTGPDFSFPSSIAIEPFQTLDLRFSDAYAAPGGQAVVPVILKSIEPVTGVQFRIQPQDGGAPTGLAQFTGAVNHYDHLGFDVTTATAPDGVTSVVMLNFSSASTLPTGEKILMELFFQLDENTPVDTELELVVTDNLVTDENIEALLHQVEVGHIRIGQPGDPTLDGNVNILDIARVIRYILLILPEPVGFDLFLSDANGDDILDIRDAITMINLFLFGEPTPPVKTIGVASTQTAVAGLGDIRVMDTGQMAIPILLESDGGIAGMQARLSFDEASLSIGAPILVDRADGLTLQYRMSDGTLRLIGYSTEGSTLPPGSGATVLIPVSFADGANPAITLDDVILADRAAQTIDVRLEQTVVRPSSNPTTFSLQTAYPNPFNPSTNIAYTVPQQAHIQLVVYNLLGQEVIRLVDGKQAAGRYEVVWNARNAQGAPVASGIYVYRLTSSTGFSEARRMTLVK